MAPPKKMRKPKIKSVGGRPTHLTHELIQKIVAYIKVGSYVETAFQACGVPRKTFYLWMKKGRLKKGSIYSALVHTLDQAVSEGEIRDILIIDRAANGAKPELLKDKKGDLVYDEEGRPIVARAAIKPDWKAAAWRAERRHPDHWGRSGMLEELESIFRPSQTEEDKDSIEVDPYSIRSIYDKVRSEY